MTEKWRSMLQKSMTDPEELAALFSVDPAPLAETAAEYPMRITPYYLGLIRSPGDPIWRQCVPDPRERLDRQSPDPLAERSLSPIPGLIHRYPDRVVWLVSGDCAVYCRFCMRKRNFRSCRSCVTGDADAVIAYLEGHPEVRDVTLSGGDPLMLADETLHALLGRLRRIRSVEIIRIGTRLPVTLPRRVTASLCRMLRQHHPLYLNLHFNHPSEITPESAGACARLADCGLPLGNQTVLLKGVNDSPATMKLLMQRLLALRVRPYYIHQADLVRGTAHFRTPLAKGIEIVESLRGHTSGLANPHLVVDLPGGKGKVPLAPEWSRKEGEKTLFRSFSGEEVAYGDLVE